MITTTLYFDGRTSPPEKTEYKSISNAICSLMDEGWKHVSSRFYNVAVMRDDLGFVLIIQGKV